MIIRNSS